jgi:hypothetical protein
MAKRKKQSSRKVRQSPKARVARKPAKKLRTPKRPTAAAVRTKGAVPHAVALLRWVHETFDNLVRDFPKDRATFQASPTDNHLLWTLGHLATSYSWFASLIDGQAAKLPENYQGTFGYQSKPSGNPADYPPFEEVKAACDSAFSRLIQAAEALTETSALLPCMGDPYGWAKDRLDVVAKAAWHEGWHSGQVSALRRALGIKGIF